MLHACLGGKLRDHTVTATTTQQRASREGVAGLPRVSSGSPFLGLGAARHWRARRTAPTMYEARDPECT